MKEPTLDFACPVSAEDLLHTLASRWGIQASTVTPIPGGNSGQSWVARLNAEDGSYFLKVQKEVDAAGMAVSSLLAGRGAPALAALPSSSGKAWESIDGLHLLIYPLLEGSSVDFRELAAKDWRSLGAALRMVHETPVFGSLKDALTSADPFVPWGREFIGRWRSAMDAPERHSDAQQTLARMWNQNGSFLEEFFHMTCEKGELALASGPRSCLCHNDLHSGNVFRTVEGKIVLIDWARPALKPPERDFLHIDAEHHEAFERGYGSMDQNEAVLAYMNADWLLQDLLDCADRILFQRAIGAAEKQDALQMAEALFLKMKALLQAC